MGRVKHDIAGQRFGRLVAISFAEGSKGKWNCVCDCGKTPMVSSQNLRIGKATSCGCYKAEIMAAGMNTTHGMYGTRLHTSWESMIGRCTSPTDPSYQHYGGKGVKVCERWMTFENFREDMGDRPAGMTLDRKEVTGDYEPNNCRWATPMEQANNRTNTRKIQYQGKEYTARELSDLTGAPYQRLRNRVYKLGWTAERAIAD